MWEGGVLVKPRFSFGARGTWWEDRAGRVWASGGFDQAGAQGAYSSERGKEWRVRWGRGSKGSSFRAELPQRNFWNGPLALGQN